jgi:hypothetical protein
VLRASSAYYNQLFASLTPWRAARSLPAGFSTLKHDGHLVVARQRERSMPTPPAD